MSAKAIPEPPSHVGQVTERKTIDGKPMIYTVIEEIIRVPKSNSRKAIYLQMLEHEPDGRREMRLCYSMIGVKAGRTKGKWVLPSLPRWFAKRILSF